MKLSLQTDYALRTLLYLQSQKSRCTVADVAQFYQISRDHVAKVAQALTRLGYVRSMRGSSGGMELLRDPAQITVGGVILDFEGNMHLLECVAVDNVCIIQPSCKLKGVLAEAERRQMEYLHSIRLIDLATAGQPLVAISPLPGSSAAHPQSAQPP